ncbi:helix-turn-helix domain-containing protein [Shewanella xiamenensis]|uniref:helix-turn-helix domain-containing protein n=1 Tax=Shewanella xiamenensis TaxID=332186 RepID=UPI0035BAF6E7
MVKCHLSKIMGERKVKISELARATGLNRSTLTSLYNETAMRIELDTLEKLCSYFNCEIGDLLQILN